MKNFVIDLFSLFPVDYIMFALKRDDAFVSWSRVLENFLVTNFPIDYKTFEINPLRKNDSK
jgi:hypothetical protein